MHGDQIHADIGGPAGGFDGPPSGQDGHRGVVGEALGIAVDELVEHEIADDKRADRLPVSEFVQQFIHEGIVADRARPPP